MPIPATQFIWFNGKLVAWEKATVHVLSHALHYGSSVFEGVRAYETPRGVAIFRLRDHTRRLFDSAKIYRIPLSYSVEQLNEACRQVIAANGLKRGAYIRPVVFRGYGEIGVTPKIEPPTEVAVAAWEWGKYLGADAEEHGVDACISSWQRVAPNTLPALAKAGGNYLSSQLIGMEARRLGFAEGIGLSSDGTLSEGSGENLFLVKDGTLLTPALAHSVLGGPHARYRHAPRPRARHRGARERAAARVALHRRRGLLHRHGGGDHPDPLGRPPEHRQWQARTDHRDPAERLLWPVRRQDPRQVGLARLRRHVRAARRGLRLMPGSP